MLRIIICDDNTQDMEQIHTCVTKTLFDLEDIQLSGEPDIFQWNLHQNGKFSVKSMYDAMVHCDVSVDNKKL